MKQIEFFFFFWIFLQTLMGLELTKYEILFRKLVVAFRYFRLCALNSSANLMQPKHVIYLKKKKKI